MKSVCSCLPAAKVLNIKFPDWAGHPESFQRWEVSESMIKREGGNLDENQVLEGEAEAWEGNSVHPKELKEVGVEIINTNVCI